jgi:5-methylthioadenosine/S-adenosylhomocysteine deaminase
MLAETGTHLSLSPLTEYASMGIAPLGAFLAAGIPVSLSIDTLAIPTVADMFLQMRVTLAGERARTADTTLTARRVLELATIDGARDLGLDDRIGSLHAGKRADLVAVRMDSLNMAPAADPLALLVHAASPADVDLVVADGRILKRDGRPTAFDPAAIVADARSTLRDILGRAGWDARPGVAADAPVPGPA